MPATPALKLTYFDIDGRAAVIRKTFTLGGIPFEDERVPRDLTPLMHKLPYGKVPVLEIDGEVVAETQVLQRYAGQLTGMYPPSDEPLATAMVDEIIDSFDDFFQRIMMPSFVERDATKKKEMREALLQGPLTNALELLDTRLAQIQEYPFFKDNATKVYIHEIMAWNYVGFMRSGIVDHVPTTFIDKYKTMVAMHAKIEGLTDVNQRFPIYESSPKLTPPKKLKLTYFDMPGRAEQIRIALQIGGRPFEDERISFEEVTKRKHEFPNGQVPVLLVDDKYILAQSVTILRYVGKFTGLYPVNDTLSAMKIDEVLSHIEELYYALDPSFMEKDPAKKKAMRETLATSTIPKSLDSLNKRLDQFKLNVKSPFAMGGENPTIADLGIYSLVMFLQSGFLDHVPTTIVDAYPHILQSNEAVRQYPRVQEWYASKSLPAV